METAFLTVIAMCLYALGGCPAESALVLLNDGSILLESKVVRSPSSLEDYKSPNPIQQIRMESIPPASKETRVTCRSPIIHASPLRLTLGAANRASQLYII